MVAIIQITAIKVSAILLLEGPVFSEDKSVEDYNGTISEEKLETAVIRYTDIRTLKTKRSTEATNDQFVMYNVTDCNCGSGGVIECQLWVVRSHVELAGNT